MKRITTMIALCLLAMAVGAQSLYVGSYNVRYQNDGDAKEGNAWTQRGPVLAALLNVEHPDIFGTQEVLKSQLDDLTAWLPDYDHIGVGRDDGLHGGEHEAIFYDRNRLRLLDHGDFWLSETPDRPTLGWDAACIRVCTWGCFKDRKTKRKFYFFNLHMDHVGIVARREAAKLVVRRIGEICHGKPVVLTGDFNVDQTNEIYRTFTESGVLNDTYEHAQVRFAENGTFNAFKPDLKTESRIDHVFVSPRFRVERYAVRTDCYWVPTAVSDQKQKGRDAPQEIDFASWERRLPSDHYPVFVRIR